MPRVGSKHFSYSPKGRKAAKTEARRTGRPVTHAMPDKDMVGPKGMPTAMRAKGAPKPARKTPAWKTSRKR